ncbi:MAG: hypothetical protein M1838_005628 [Thelocarpon superellum]|nr:MAG: hypothetical protein M1838_005628 [Thelocarpon superellum]
MAPLNILIIGCSIAGPTLAAFLLLAPLPASEKPRITILERSSALRTAGQNIDIRGAGVTIIRKLGLEALVRASTTGEEGVQFVDAENRVWGAFAAGKGGQSRTPTSEIEIMRGTLADICFKRSKSVSDEVQGDGGAGVEYVFGDSLEGVEQDGDQVHVRFAKSGERRSYDLVVGADGLQSQTRNMVWGVEGEKDRLKKLGMYAAFFSMSRAKTDSLWRRWFHAPGRRGIMLRPDQQRGRTTALVSVVNEKDTRLVEVATRGHAKEQKKLMEEYFRGVGWESERVLDEMTATKDFYYDMVAQIKMDRWSKGRVVLLGDAGYCASPISGMGTTLALVGAYNLAGALTRHPDDYTQAFAEYEKHTRPAVDRAQKLVPGMSHILHPETAWGVWTLNAIMSFLTWTRIATLLFMFIGPPADTVSVEEYGFKQLPVLQA